MKIRFALKRIFSVKRIIIAVVVIAILAMIVVPRYIKNSRNQAAQNLLIQIALAELGSQPEGRDVPYSFTDGKVETAEEAVKRLAIFGFRPDPSVAFHIMPPAVIDDVTPHGYIAFTAHNSVGSIVYVYDNLAIEKRFRPTQEGAEYGGVKFTSATVNLLRYKYDTVTKTVEKMPSETKYGPTQKGEYPGRMVVTVAAE